MMLKAISKPGIVFDFNAQSKNAAAAEPRAEIDVLVVPETWSLSLKSPKPVLEMMPGALKMAICNVLCAEGRWRIVEA